MSKYELESDVSLSSGEGDSVSKLGKCLGDLLLMAPALHRLHLKITGPGSFAAHMALGDAYTALPGCVDTVAEGYQGVTGSLLDVQGESILKFDSTEQVIEMCDMYNEKLSQMQSRIGYSEIVNNIDLIKDLLNTLKYKLKFLQ